MKPKYTQPDFITKADMRREMLAVASDLRRASSNETRHETLREWALNAAEVLEIMASGPTMQEITAWVIGVALGAYGLFVILVCGFEWPPCCR